MALDAPLRLPRIVFALPHQLWTGADFLANPLATGYWWTAWAGTAAAVVVYRVALPTPTARCGTGWLSRPS